MDLDGGDGPPKPGEAEFYARAAREFEHLRGLAPGARGTRLDALEAVLRHEVEELLAASEVQGGDALSDGRIEAGARVVPWTGAGSDDELPERIDGYRVLRRIGEGGMGVVYEAEQDAPRRRVALKLVRAELAFGERLRRFRLEAEALGRLKHPGIAQVYALGTCDVGRGEQPYFAMELVDGEPLLVHAASASLDRRARLALVAELCDAVQHAHERGVVHRDLKPDNVLVDAAGRAKVLDFGVARVRADNVALTTVHTSQGQLVGTLTHMAPEQLAGDPDAVGPAADVYALGVIAFELLTGRLPHEVAGLPITQAMRRITEGEAPLLGALDRGLRGDVETIVGKALAQEPARRYVSAAALAADLRRFLAHEPIAARRPSLAYRAARFTRRRPALVGGTAATLLAVVVGVAGVLSFAAREAAWRRAAERTGIDALAVSLASIRSTLDEGERWTARELLDRIPAEQRGWEWGWLARQSPLLLDGRAHPSEFLGHHLVTVTPLQGEEVRLGSVDLADPDGRLVLFPDDRRIYGFARGAEGLLAAVFLEEDRDRGDLAVLDLLRGRTLAHVPWDRGGYPLALARDGTVLQSFLRVTKPGVAGSDASSLPVQIQLPGEELVSKMAHLSSDGRYVACGTRSRQLVLFDARSGELVASRPSEGPPYPRFLSDDERLVNAMPGAFEVLAVPSLEILVRTDLPDTEFVWLSSDDHGTVALSTRGAGILIVDAETGEVRQRIENERFSVKGTEVVSLSSDGRFLAANAGESDRAWISEPGAPPVEPFLALRHPGPVLGACFLPDGASIATIAAEGIRFWDAEDGTPVATLAWPEGTRAPLADSVPPLVSDEGRRLLTAACAGDEVILLSIDLQGGAHVRAPTTGLTDEHGFTPELLHSLAGRSGRLDLSRLGARACVLPGGRETLQTVGGSIVRASLDRSTQVSGDWGSASGVDLSPDGRLLACADQGAVRIVEVDGGAEVAVALQAREAMRFREVAWSPDGTRLAAARQDGRLFLVETRYFREVLELPSGASELRYLAWSPDGTRLIAADGDTLRVHDSIPVIPRRLRAEARAERVRHRSTRLEELGSGPQACKALLSEAAGDEEALVAARRAVLLRLAAERD